MPKPQAAVSRSAHLSSFQTTGPEMFEIDANLEKCNLGFSLFFPAWILLSQK